MLSNEEGILHYAAPAKAYLGVIESIQPPLLEHFEAELESDLDVLEVLRKTKVSPETRTACLTEMHNAAQQNWKF